MCVYFYVSMCVDVVVVAVVYYRNAAKLCVNMCGMGGISDVTVTQLDSSFPNLGWTVCCLGGRYQRYDPRSTNLDYSPRMWRGTHQIADRKSHWN